jgi:hypothetical protein
LEKPVGLSVSWKDSHLYIVVPPILYGSFSMGGKIGDERNIAAQNLITLIEKKYKFE